MMSRTVAATAQLREIEEDLAGAIKLIDSQVALGLTREEVTAATHTDIIKKIDGLSEVATSEATSLSTAAGAGPWNAEQKKSFADAIRAAQSRTCGRPVGRRPMQYCLTFPHFVLPTERVTLRDPNLLLTAACKLISGRGWAIGLSCPSEGTKEVMARYYLHLSGRDLCVDTIKSKIAAEIKHLDKTRRYTLCHRTHYDEPAQLSQAMWEFAGYNREQPTPDEEGMVAASKNDDKMRKSRKSFKINKREMIFCFFFLCNALW